MLHGNDFQPQPQGYLHLSEGRAMEVGNWQRLCCPATPGNQSLSSPGDGDFS